MTEKSTSKSYPTFLADVVVKPYSNTDIKFNTGVFLEIIEFAFDGQIKQSQLEEISQYAGQVPSCKIISLPYEIAVEKIKIILEFCFENDIQPFELSMTQREWK